MKKTIILSLSLCLFLVACSSKTVQQPTEYQQANQSSMKMIEEKKWNDGYLIVRETDVKETIDYLNWLDGVFDNAVKNPFSIQKANQIVSGFVLLRVK